MWMSHSTHMNESQHTCEWVTVHIRKSHVTHINKVAAHIWKSRVTPIWKSHVAYIYWCVWHDPFRCVLRLYWCVWHDSFICVLGLIHMCAMTHSHVLYWCVWHESVISQHTSHCTYITAHIWKTAHTWKTAHVWKRAHNWKTAHICKTAHMKDRTHMKKKAHIWKTAHIYKDSTHMEDSTYMKNSTHMKDSTHMNMNRGAVARAGLPIHVCDMTLSYVCDMTLSYACDMTLPYVCCDAFICVPWLIHIFSIDVRDMTLSQDSTHSHVCPCTHVVQRCSGTDNAAPIWLSHSTLTTHSCVCRDPFGSVPWVLLLV